MFSDNPFDDVGENPLQPLKEQIVIIRGCARTAHRRAIERYKFLHRTLRQAAEAGRLDEVHMLEKNLRELEEELDKQTRPATLQ